MRDSVKCEICSEELSKYKCPKCLTKYCSVACYRTHSLDLESCKLQRKENVPEEENLTEIENSLEKNEMTDDQVLLSQLQKLETSIELKDLFANRHLCDMLIQVNNSNQINRDIEKAMQEPIFCEFASKCLEVVKNGESVIDSPNLILPEVNDTNLKS